MEKVKCKVCVTGAAGFIGSSLTKKLLEKGHTVHATLRNLGDLSKVELLKSFPQADTKLALFEADINKPNEFEPAIHGCTFVFHVATPMQNSDASQFKNTTEAAVSAIKSIAECCLKSGTVKRLIYTASVCAASPLKNDGFGYKDFMDETCWRPLNLSLAYSNDFFKDYTSSKTLSEKEVLRYGSSEKDGGMEVVTLACGIVGGDAALSYTPGSVAAFISQLTNDAFSYQALKYTEELLGKLPIVHINDVCHALVFCMLNPSIGGRFLTASSFVSAAELADCYRLHYPEFNVKEENLDGSKSDVKWGSTKLIEKGFEYKCHLKMIMEDSIKCARRNGLRSAN
ncbi:putative anthocyanidin reductase [Hibiscus syriacus]|uniref:putative anthocyanidin reductase n=1 Tax=Hibiscus syriacus TaxID=106335 RepID=UPI001920A7CD|nr:putative anthocyanidin reductase [Hibiscus syriacus]